MDGIIVFIGWLSDLILGDPPRWPHPVVWFGKWIAWGEHRWNHGVQRKRKGALFVVGSIVGLLMLAAMVIWLLPAWAVGIITVITVFFCLAGHTLRREVRDVFTAVDRSLDEGRSQVGRIVGRDTSELSAQEVRTAALETLAENLSDGVIAPLFWFLLLGVPGMLTYKLINTFDSMVGYKTQRYKDFGCWAAHIDDVANFLPARITALLILLIGWILDGFHSSFFRQLRLLFMFGPQHASPNSGWPEAALAIYLDCRFGGPHYYFGEYVYKPFIGTNDRMLQTADMRRSIRLCFLTELVFVFLVILCVSCLK